MQGASVHAEGVHCASPWQSSKDGSPALISTDLGEVQGRSWSKDGHRSGVFPKSQN